MIFSIDIKNLVEQGGVDALINQSRKVPNLKNRVDEQTEIAVLEHAIEYPAHGQAKTSNECVRTVFSSHPLACAVFGLDMFGKLQKTLKSP